MPESKLLLCIFILDNQEEITTFKTSVFFCQSLDLTAQTKALQEQNAELEKEMVELKKKLEEQTTVTTIQL